MDNTEEKPKKLGLKLKANVDTKDLAKNYIDLQAKSGDDVRKAQSLQNLFQADGKNANLTNDEVSKRLDVLKRAAQDKEEREIQISAKKSNQAVEEENIQQHKAETLLLDEIASAAAETAPAQETLAISPVVLEKPKQTPQLKVEALQVGKKVTGRDDEAAQVVAKPKLDPQRKLKKQDLYNFLDDEAGAGRSFKRRNYKNKAKVELKTEKIIREVELYDEITVTDLANKMSERSVDLIKELMKLGVMADANKVLDLETAELLVSTFGHKFKHVKEVTVHSILADHVDDPALLRPRAPIVTVMGHVDHGKTSLLDAIRSTDVALKEFGGITQNIGAYQVLLANGRKITFIDTPGHEAFTAMRSRGAQVTDLVVLVVAADDGIKAQTIEAINHAKAAKLPIIVAVNKIDKVDDANLAVSRIKNELLSYDLIAEDMGGDVIFVPVSALKRINLDKLEETILLLADFIDVKGNYDTDASGVVLDAKLDKYRGAMTSILVTRGVLKLGQFVVAGSTYGKIKRIQDDKGREITFAEPSSAVSILGLEDVASAGDKFVVMSDEKLAKELADSHSDSARAAGFVLAAKSQNLLDPFTRGKQKELRLIIKADSQGSLEAILGSLGKIIHDEVIVKILHRAVGGVNESDISLASASKAMVFAFNVRPSQQASSVAAKENVQINCYSIIYDLIDDVKVMLSGMLAPNIREVWLGNVEIRQVFNLTKVGKVAGCYVLKGIAKRGAGMRLLRDDIVRHEGKLKTLRRFKEDIKEVKENYECGIVFEDYQDIQVGDKVEIFEYIEEKRGI